MKNTSSFRKYKSSKSEPRLSIFWGERKVIHTFTSQWFVSTRRHKALAIPHKRPTFLYPEVKQQVKLLGKREDLHGMAPN